MDSTPHTASNPSEGDYVVAEFADQGGKPRGKFSGRLLILFVILLVVGPLLYHWIPQEAARWRIAAAEEQRLAGDLAGAIDSLSRALDRYPQNVDLLLRRAELRLENKEYEQAIADCGEALKLDPNLIAAYFVRSQAYHHLSRHAEAIADCQNLMRLAEEGRWSRVLALNSLAYGRALGKTELEEGLANVEEAIRLGGETPEMLDTRGYLHYLLGDPEPALVDLNKAVMEGEVRLARLPAVGQFPDARRYQVAREPYEQAVAVMRYHRGLVQLELGNYAQAEADFERVRELGHEPTEDLF